MDSSNSNQSPSVPDNSAGAWFPVWDGDESSITGLTLGMHQFCVFCQYCTLTLKDSYPVLIDRLVWERHVACD